MPSIDELTDYVFEHPEAYEERWRLAKRLYTEGEYEDALKHLTILKRRWMKKLNVLRYLAATYYRLERFDDAIAELKETLVQWPRETPVLEQLAKVYEASGQTSMADAVWAEIAKFNPEHAAARRDRRSSIDLLEGADSSRIAPARGEGATRACPNCGARNSEVFDRCWQCHAPLHVPARPVEPALTPDVAPTRMAPWLLTLAGGAATVALLTVATYLALRTRNDFAAQLGIESAPSTVSRALAEDQYAARLIVALVLTAFWPVALWAGFASARSPRPPIPALCGAALLLGAMTYLSMWLPAQWMFLVPLAPALSALVIVYLCEVRKPRAILVAWGAQGILVLFLAAAVYAITERPQSVTQIPAMISYARAHATRPAPGPGALYDGVTPDARRISFAETGSTWLDARLNRVTLEAHLVGGQGPVAITLREGGSIIAYADEPPLRVTSRIQPGLAYALEISGKPDTHFQITYSGVLAPTVSTP
jgi:tetratricopeptide (TPR) repeat protein